MPATIGQSPVAERPSFLVPALRRLGGSVGVNYCCHDGHQGGIREVQAVFVSCPRAAWIAEFGEPQRLCEHFDVTSGKWIWSWEHQLPQGRIHCVGQFFQRSGDGAWIIVRQLSIHRTDEFHLSAV
jgi:hypothetical protein